MNLLEGRVASRGPEGLVVDTQAGPIRAAEARDVQPGARVWIALRPEKLALAGSPPSRGGPNAAGGVVSAVVFRGETLGVQLRLADGLVLKAALPNGPSGAARRLAVGDAAWLTWPAEAAVVLSE